jgi:hypothetical protein
MVKSLITRLYKPPMETVDSIGGLWLDKDHSCVTGCIYQEDCPIVTSTLCAVDDVYASPRQLNKRLRLYGEIITSKSS